MLAYLPVGRLKKKIPVRGHDEAKGPNGRYMALLRVFVLRNQRRQFIDQGNSIVEGRVFVAHLFNRALLIIIGGVVALDQHAELMLYITSSKPYSSPGNSCACKKDRLPISDRVNQGRLNLHWFTLYIAYQRQVLVPSRLKR